MTKEFKPKDIPIAHICIDEKFIDCAIHIFESINGIKNTFYCYTTQPLHFIKNKKEVKTYNDKKKLIEQINTCNYTIIFLHGRILPYPLLYRIKEQSTLVWLSWGFDLYNNNQIKLLNDRLININLYKPITRSTLLKPKMLLRFAIEIARKIKNEKLIYAKKFYKRVDYISTVLPEEYEFIKEKCEKFSIKNFEFKYLIEEDIPKDIQNHNKEIKNILIGNSGSESNNHLDILYALHTIDTSKRKIIIPINYAGKMSYVKEIKKTAHQLGINNITYLERFIPYKEYARLLNSCSIAIFGHIRQQALGNIYMLLQRGVKIFLYRDSFVYKSLKKVGYKIYSIEDMTGQSLNEPLSMQDCQNNLNLYRKFANFPSYLQNLSKEIHDIVCAKSNHISSSKCR